MQVLCSLYLSLKCDNSENSLNFKNEEKRRNINTQRNYTNECNFAFGKSHKYSFYMSKLNYQRTTQMDVYYVLYYFTCSNVVF